MALLPPPASAVPIVPFSPRFSADDNGTVVIYGNNLLSCATTDTRCAAARAGTANLNNNSFVMQHLDTDAVASTFNSSSADVAVPANGDVLWAGLYWGARASRGAGGAAGLGDRRVMSFRPAGAAGYTSVTSQASFGPTSGDLAYQEFAEVTALVRAGGTGTYWGANVVTGTGEDRYAGWSLVVVVRAPDLPLRSLTVFDGFADVGAAEPQQIALSGFRTPVSGPVETQLGMVAYEGDFATSGDNARLNDTLLSTTPLSRGSNFFNGTNDTNGVSVTARNPAHLNMLGFDIKNLAASGIPNGATSATVSLESTGERYFPGVVTTAIRLFAPDFTTSTKTVANLAGRTPAYPGDELEYTLTYPNTGQDPATNTVMTDVLPPGTTFVSADPTSGSCTGAGRNVTCTIGTIAIGASWQVRVRASVGAAAGGTTLTNAAVLSYTATSLGRDLQYTVAPAVIAVDAAADLSLSKSMSPDPGTAGGEVTAVLTVANAGPNAATGVIVSDRIPAGTGVVSTMSPQGTCSVTAEEVSCALGTVAEGATVSVTVVLSIPSGSTASSIVNVATVTSQTADLDPGDNAAGASVAVARAADLSVTKRASPASVPPGGTTSFSIVVTNDGPSDAVAVVATDTVSDPAMTLTGASAPGATCTVGADVAQCSLPVLAAGASVEMTVTARTSPDLLADATIVDTATATSTTPDADSSDNTATAMVTTTAPQADIRTSKSGTDAIAGGQTTYSVQVTNAGPSAAETVTLDDALPAGLTATSVVSSRGSCTIAATVTCDLGALPGPDPTGALASATITIIADVDASVAAGDLVNTATASTDTDDPDATNDSATVTTQVTTLADVSVTKTANPVQPAAGEDVTFTMTLANAGPSTARDLVLTDVLPPGLTLLGVDPAPGLSCSGTATVTCTLAQLAPSATSTLTVRMNVPSAFDLETGAVNTATVTSSTGDPVAGNNTATATVTTRAISDVAVLKWETTPLPPPPGTPPRAFDAGETVTYNIAALNFGPSDAASARVVDTLPAGVTYVSSVPECSFVAPDQVVCDLPTVPNQFAAIFPVTVRVDPGLADGATLTNTATIELTDPQRVDPVTSNNLAAISNPVTTHADLNVVKQTYSLDLPGQTFQVPSSAPPGSNTGYGIDIRNDGPSVARDVVLIDSSTMTDFVIVRVLFVRPGVDPVDITTQCSFTGADLQCPLGDIPVFAAGDTSWRVQVDGVTLSNATPGSYVNTATLTSSTPELEPADNTAQAPITVTAPVATLTIDKAVQGGADVDGDGDIDLVPGTAFSYQLTVENVPDLQREGASDAPDVVVSDVLPAGLTAVTASSTQGACSISPPGTVSCELGTVLGPGRLPQPPPVVITISGTVEASLAGTPSATNTATVTSPISAPASDSVTQDVVAVADLSIVKVPDSSEVAAGSVAGFSLVVTNAGPSDAVATEVGDLFPPEITFDPAASDPSCSMVTIPEGTYVSCPIGTLGAGESRTVRVAGSIPSNQPAAQVVNVSAVSSPITGEADFTNNRSDVPISIVQNADLVVGKTADATSQAVGQQVTYTLSVTNAGPSDASDVVLGDLLPGELSFVSAVGDGVVCALEGGVVLCRTPTLAAGAAATATVVVELPVGIDPGPIVNTAAASSAGTPDLVPQNNEASATIDAFILADARITKTVITPDPVAGQPITFAIDVRNTGPQLAPRVVVSDALTPGLTLVAAQAAAGSCQVTSPEDLDVVTCELGSLAVGATARVLVTVLTDPTMRSITNGALVGSAAQDALSDDNYDEVDTALAAPVGPSDPAPPIDPPATGSAGLTASGLSGATAVLAVLGISALLIGLVIAITRRRRPAGQAPRAR